MNFFRRLKYFQRDVLATLRYVYKTQRLILQETRNMAKTLDDLKASITELEKTEAEVKAVVVAALVPPDFTAEVARIDAVAADLKTLVPSVPPVV